MIVDFEEKDQRIAELEKEKEERLKKENNGDKNDTRMVAKVLIKC